MGSSSEGEEYLRLSQSIRSCVRRYMREHGIEPDQLAGLLGVPAGRAVEVLGEEQNLTIRTLNALAHSMGARFEVRLVPRDPNAVGNRQSIANMA
jgi:hypothetical protein